MTAGGGDLERTPGDRLAADVGEILQTGVRLPTSGHGGTGRVELATTQEPVVDLPERARPGDRDPGDQRGLVQVVTGDQQETGAAIAGGERRSEHAPYRAQITAEAELAERPQGLNGVGGDQPGGGQQADSDRQIEAGALLGQVGRRKRDGDAPVRPVETRIGEGGADAVACLKHDGVAKADDTDGGQAPAEVDLDPDRMGGAVAGGVY